MNRFKYIAVLFLVALIVGCSGAAHSVDTEPVAPEPPPVPSEPVTPPKTSSVDPPPVVPTPPPPPGGGTPPPQDSTVTVVSFLRNAGANANEGRRLSGALSGSVANSGISVWDSVREGGSFRIRVGFSGRSPVEGGCNLGVQDSNGDTSTVTSWANGEDTSALIRVEHDNAEEDGRTVTVSINSCDFPDLNRAGITIRIGQPNSVAVAVTTAGDAVEDPNTYEFNLTSLTWSNELGHDGHGDEYMSADFTGTISNTLPWEGLLQWEYTDSYTGVTEWLGTHLYKGESAINGGISGPVSPPGTVRTMTITLKSWRLTQSLQDGHYYAPSGGTYVIGAQTTVTATFTTPDFVRPPDPIYTVSMTPFGGGAEGSPVTEGDKIMFNISVENILGIYFTLKFRDNWRTVDDVDHSPMWMNPENGGPTQSRERTTMVCCNGDGWLPEAERPEVRTYTAMLWQSTNLRASTTVRLGSAGSE